MLRFASALLALIGSCAYIPLVYAEEIQNFRISALPNCVAAIEQSECSRSGLDVVRVLIEVMICGGNSETTVIAAIANTTKAEMAGRVILELPETASNVTYALDVDGAVTDDAKITVEHATRFRTNPFAFPEDGERTISIRYSAPYDPAIGFAFPINELSPQTWIFLTVDAREMVVPPVVRLPGGNVLKLDQNEIGWRSSFADGLYRGTRDAAITITDGDLTKPLLN